MAQGRSTKIISIIKWIRTSRLSIDDSLSRALPLVEVFGVMGEHKVIAVGVREERGDEALVRCLRARDHPSLFDDDADEEERGGDDEEGEGEFTGARFTTIKQDPV